MTPPIAPICEACDGAEPMVPQPPIRTDALTETVWFRCPCGNSVARSVLVQPAEPVQGDDSLARTARIFAEAGL